jgi:hypothetical protein
MTRRRRPAPSTPSAVRRAGLVVGLVVGLAAALLVLAACGGSDRVRSATTGTTGSAPTTTGPGAAGTGPATPSGTVAPDAPGVDLRVVFLDDGKLATAHRRVAPTQAVARAALEQLLAGPTPAEQALGYGSAVRTGSVVTGVRIADGTATVTLDPPLAADAAALPARAQIVATLTQFPTVRAVQFGTEGPPRTRADFRDLTPLVFPESVAPGDLVRSPVTVAGEANTFEATVRIRIVGADGRVLADTFTTATAGTGTWGTFSERVAFDPRGNRTGKVVVFWDSPKDGAPLDVVEIPVRFA